MAAAPAFVSHHFSLLSCRALRRRGEREGEKREGRGGALESMPFLLLHGFSHKRREKKGRAIESLRL